MKKLLVSLATISIVASTGSMLTACNNNSSNTTNDDQKNFDSIKSNFQNGVDGSQSLSTADTEQDGANYLQNWAEINVDNEATVSISTQQQVKLAKSSDHLNAGEDYLNVSLAVGTVKGSFIAKIMGIKNASDEEYAIKIKKVFEAGVNADTLSTDTSYAQAIDELLLPTAHSINNSATVVLDSKLDPNTKLHSGNNSLSVTIGIGSESLTAIAQLENVTDPTSATINNVATYLVNGVNASGSNLVSGKDTFLSGTDYLQGIVRILVPDAQNVKISLLNPGDETKKLTSGNVEIHVIVSLNSKEVVVQNALLINVQSSSAETKTAIMNRLSSGINGSALNVTRTVGSALLLLRNSIIDISADATLDLQDSTVITDLLVAGSNTIHVVLTVGNESPVTIDAVVNNVSSLTNDEILNLIKIKLEAGVYDANLTLTSTFNDAISLFLTQAQIIAPSVKLSLTNSSDATKNLITGTNQINVTLTLNGDTLVVIDATVTLTKDSISQDQANANIIKAQFEAGILALPLASVLNTQNDGLLLLNVRAKLVDENATVTFVNSDDASKKLISPVTLLNVLITVKDGKATTTQAKLTGIAL